jgi:hypothetical protein
LGPKVAEVPLRQAGRRVRFAVPLSVFDRHDGVRPYEGVGFGVHYFLEAYDAARKTGYLPKRSVGTVASTDAEIVVAPINPDAPIYRTRQGPLVVDLITHPAEFYGDYLFAELVDLKSLRFGPNEVRPYRSRLIDIDGDGYLDLRLWFEAPPLGLTCIDDELWLTGEQWEGETRQAFVGYDRVSIAGCG